MLCLRRARSLFGLRAMVEVSTTFEYSDEDLKLLEEHHDDMLWIPYDSTELYLVTIEDDTRTDRTHYGFGNVCPLGLARGVDCCKKFEKKVWSVKSCVSRKMAYNYLAKHAFDSSNHPTMGDKASSFAAAHQCKIIEEPEPFEWREEHRQHCASYSEGKESKSPGDGDKRDRSRSNRRKREKADFEKNKRVRSLSRDAKRDKRDAVLPRVQVRSLSSGRVNANLGAIVPAAQYAKSVKVSTAELQVLEGCLGRAIDSQKRTVEALHFAARQIEDEKKIFIEAREVIKNLVDRVRVD
jgi:hypothetical protein